MATGLVSNLPYALTTEKEMIYVKTNIGGFFFDGFMETEHTHQLKITEHPVQTGAQITDHSFMQPAELSMTVKMSDVMQGLFPSQFTGSYSRSVSAYNVLRELQESRIPMQVVTRLQIYQNMLIESLVVSDDLKTLYGLDAKINLKQIMVVNVKTIKTASRTNVTATQNTSTSNVANFGDFQQLQRNGKTTTKSN